MTEVLPNAVIDTIRQRHPETWGIYLFGSRADNSARHDSDWDIGLVGNALAKMDLLDTTAKLSSLLGGEVDLVDLSRASTALRFEVLRKGILAADFNTLHIQRFEMETLTAYQNLNESRKQILRDFGVAV